MKQRRDNLLSEGVGSVVTDKAWNKYFNDRNIENRNEIVGGYVYYVHYLVKNLFYGAPEGISKEDLIQSGMCGLIESVERFNPINENKFETYAKIRIQGAIYDYIRYYKKCNLGISRIKSSKIREIIEKKNELEQRYARTPTKLEIANELNMEVREYEKILQDKEVKVFYEEDFLERKNSLEATDKDRGIETPEQSYIIKEERELLMKKIDMLNDVQQQVLKMYYFEENNFKEIGQKLELTESRISQIHKKAIFRLKYLLDVEEEKRA